MDLSTLTDAQLQALHSQSGNDLAALSDEQLKAAYAGASNSIAGSAKAIGSGLANAGIGLAGMSGDARGMAAGLANWAVPGLGPAADKALKFVPGMGGPSSQDVRGAIESQIGSLDYQPQTTTEKFLKTGAEFLPAAASPGSVLRKAGQVVLPAVASELAGKASEGTAAEPYVRAAAGVGGSILAHKVTNPSIPALKPNAEQVKAAGSAGYNAPEIANVKFKPNAADDVANIITNDLNSQKFNARVAGDTRSVVDELRTPIGQEHTIEDFETTRRRLSDIAGNFNNPTEQKAATIAIKTIDAYMKAIPQSHLLAGNAALANAALTRARSNYALGSSASRVEEKLRNAELQAGSAHSGGNIDNATRQKLRPLLTSKKQGRGLSDEDLALIENTVTGPRIGNYLRTGGKLLGGGGGLGSLVSGEVGSHMFGPLGYVAPMVGFAAKKAGDTITKRNAASIVDNILSRSPEAQQWAAMQQRIAGPKPPQLQSALLSALLAAMATPRVGVGQ